MSKFSISGNGLLAHQKIYFYALMLMAISIPTYSGLVNISIGLLAVVWVFEGNWTLKTAFLKKDAWVVAMLAFYLLHVIGLVYSSNISVGLHNLEKKLPLLVFPIIVGLSSYELNRKSANQILIAYVLSCLAVSLFCLFKGGYHYIVMHDTSHLFHDELAGAIGLQPVYFGLYLCFASVVLATRLLQSQLTKMQTAASLLLLVFFFLFVVLLSARLSIFCMALIFSVAGFLHAKRNKRILVFLLGGLALTAALALMVYKSDILRDRISSLATTKFYFDPNENNANGLTLRLVKWQCSLEGLSTNYLLGVGTGDMQDFLQKCYAEKNFWGQVYEFNSHNQFFQICLGLGLVGLICFLCCFGFLIRQAIQRKTTLPFYFVMLVAGAALTESIL